ncbi:MAG: PAS domain S-box protein, partial [Chitinispirillaceae bacterium]|nr:PAS domain S-box protein [Chitinispirillaceae bacterium]
MVTSLTRGNGALFILPDNVTGGCTLSLVAAIKFITFIESVLLAGIVLRRAPRDGTSLLFAIYCACIAASSFVEFQLVNAATVSGFLFWKQFDTFMYFATITMFHFALRMWGWKGATMWQFKVLLYGSFAAIALLEGFVLRPESVITGIWGFRSVYGESALNLHSVFVVITGALAISVAVLLFACMKRAREPRERKRLELLFLTSAILVACGVSAEVTVAIFDRTELSLSITATSAYFLLNPLLAYALVRYNILGLSPGTIADIVLKTMSDALVLVEKNGTIGYVNRAFCSLTGIPAGRLNGTSFDTLPIRFFSPQNGRLEFAAVRESPDGLSERECLIECAGGSLSPVSLSSAVIKSDDEMSGGYIVTLRDASERKRLDEQRQGAERIMRHDLRNALNGILGFSTLLSMDESLDPQQRENARLIEQCAHIMTDQIDAYLYLQAIERGAFHPNLEKVDLLQIVTGVMEILDALARNQNVRYQALFNNAPLSKNARCVIPGVKAILFGMAMNLVKN